MKLFYKQQDDFGKNKQFFYRFFRAGKLKIAAWYGRHSKTTKHPGVGGKNHLFEKGHVTWNRKGRW